MQQLQPLTVNEQRALVARLSAACGGAYSPEVRRKFNISGPQWAAGYDGNAIFHKATRDPITLETVIQKWGEIGIGLWCTHDTDIIPYDALFGERQWEIVERANKALGDNGVKCSMVTTETFHHGAFAAGPASESPSVREYTTKRLCNTVDIGHKLGAKFMVGWPGTLGYQVQGAVYEMQTYRWYAEGLNSACEYDIKAAEKLGVPTLKQCLEAKPFEPMGKILLPTTDSMLWLINSGLLTHPEMVGLNPEYLHDLMWNAAVRAVLARALLSGKLWHFDINDGYPGEHDVDIGVALVNPLDWLNVLVLLRSCGFEGPFNLDFKPPRTTSNHGVFEVSFPTAVDRFITLWEMAGEALTDSIINEATAALNTRLLA